MIVTTQYLIQSGSTLSARIMFFLVGRKSLPNQLCCRSYRRHSAHYP
jgi:hypothetical protein